MPPHINYCNARIFWSDYKTAQLFYIQDTQKDFVTQRLSNLWNSQPQEAGSFRGSLVNFIQLSSINGYKP